MLGELLAVVGMANETNRLANGYQVEIDEDVPDAALVGLAGALRREYSPAVHRSTIRLRLAR